MISNKVFSEKAMEALRAQLKGLALLPEEEQYNRFATAWNLNAQQRPALVIVPAIVEDIQIAVRFANEWDLGVGVMTTGHGVGKPCNGGLLINTSFMRNVSIDPSTRVANVQAGALWKDVIDAAHEHGLATLAGSAPHVGVTGYTMGGGFSYLGRKYGLNSASVTRANVVTAHGKLLSVNADQHEDLFWGLKGGGGNFGIVTDLEFRLFPISRVYGGAVFYPVEYGHQALTLYAQWTEQIPDEITSALAFMNFPPLPSIPELLRGRSVVVIKGCYCGEQPELGSALFAPIRNLAKPITDSFALMPVIEMDSISKDPVDPMGLLQYGGLIADLSPEAIDTIVSVAGEGSASPLSIVEVRKLGGALQHNGDGIQLMGDQQAQFSINAIGATPTPQMAEKVQSHLGLLARATQPYQTGEVFLNFIEVDPSAERVRAAYTTEHWQRLVSLKKKYDPKNIFRFNRNIPPDYASEIG